MFAVAAEGEVAPAPLTREARRANLGVDCAELLEWRQWEAGGEYVKDLLVKNVGGKSIKLKYRLPATKYFSMEFPEPIRLSPGMSCTVPVTFRPVRNERYDDVIEFSVGSHGDRFVVPVRAVLPLIRIESPSVVAFGFVPVRETAFRNLTVVNTGEVAVTYEWKLDAPFHAAPAAGRIAPGEVATVQASFAPVDAGAFVAEATCVVTGVEGTEAASTAWSGALAKGGKSCVTRMRGNGKFPFVSLSDAAVDFKEVLTGTTAERQLRLTNQSVVPASWVATYSNLSAAGAAASQGLAAALLSPTKGGGGVRGPEHVLKDLFTLEPSRGTLPPNGTVLLKLKYSPSTASTFSSEHFTIHTPGGNTTKLSCTGAAAELGCRLSTGQLDFGDAPTGSTVTRVLQLVNPSSTTAMFNFTCGNGENVFRVDKHHGEVAPKSQCAIVVRFTPTDAANHLRRLTCLVKDQTPLHFDCIGTGYTEKKRPPAFDFSMVDNFMSVNASSGPLARPSAWDVAFGDDNPLVGTPAVTIDERRIDFGIASARRANSEVRSVRVTNNTPSKVCCGWACPRAGRGSLPSAFAVFPEKCEIAAGESQTFKVSFRPLEDDVSYSEQLECVCYDKRMRSFRLLGSPDAFLPPWTLTLFATGATTRAGRMGYMPRSSFESAVVTLPPVRTGGASHATAVLRNHSDVPITFDFPNRSLEFDIIPRAGVIGAGEYQIFALKFEAPKGTHNQTFEERMTCVLNGSPSTSMDLRVIANAYVPMVEVSNGAEGTSVFFKPTCTGAASRRQVMLRNSSDVPIWFRWVEPKEYADADAMPNVSGADTALALPQCTVSPAVGMLRGRESMAVTWTFRPRTVGEYHNKCAVLIGGLESQVVDAMKSTDVDKDDILREVTSRPCDQRLFLDLQGSGTEGAITLEPRILNFGPQVVDNPRSMTMTLFNSSDGNTAYRLIVRSVDLEVADMVAMSADAEPDVSLCPVSTELACDAAEGDIPARAFKTLTLTLTPRTRGDKRFVIEVVSLAPHGAMSPAGPMGLLSAKSGISHPKAVLGCASVISDFPHAIVSDVSQVNGPGKTRLWDRMQLRALNDALLADPDPETEIRFNRATRVLSIEEQVSVLQTYEFNLGVGTRSRAYLPDRPRDAEGTSLVDDAALSITDSTYVTLRLVNPAGLPAKFAFTMLGEEPNSDLENWVDIGEPADAADAHRRYVLENDIINVYPRTGELGTGESIQVTFRYRHDEVGEHAVPCLLTIADGRRMVLKITGTTVPVDMRALAPPAMLYGRAAVLRKVALDDDDPAVQTVLLENVGSTDAEYEVDVSPLDELTATDGYGVEVLRLCNPTGYVAAGGAAPLRFLFKPIEAKTYRVELAVRCMGGTGCTLILEAEGYHPRVDAVQEGVETLRLAYAAASGDAGAFGAEEARALEVALKEGESAMKASDGIEIDRDGMPSDGTTSMEGAEDQDVFHRFWPGFGPTQTLCTVLRPGNQMHGTYDAHITCPAVISVDAVDFGTIPCHSRPRRVVMVTNVSDRFPCSFEFMLGRYGYEGSVDGDGLASGAISVTPSTGELAPGAAALVRVEWSVGALPQLIDAEMLLTCVYIDNAPEEARARAEAAELARAEAEGEIIARHPPPAQAQKRFPLEERDSAIFATTDTIRKRLPHLDQAHRLRESIRLKDSTIRSAYVAPEPCTHAISIRGHALVAERYRRLYGDASYYRHYPIELKPYDDEIAPEQTARFGSSGHLIEVGGSAEARSMRFTARANLSSDDRLRHEVSEGVRDIVLGAVSDAAVSAEIAALEEEAAAYYHRLKPTNPRFDGKAISVPDDAAPVPVEEVVQRDVAETAMRSTGVLTDTPPVPAVPESEDERARKLLVRRPDVATFVEFVLDSAIVGMLTESACDAWNFEGDEGPVADEE